MPRTRPRAASFPAAFLDLFLKIANSGETVVINKLENRRAAYTTFRAKLSAFRKSYHEEAIESGDPRRIAVAESLYQVTLRDPQQVNGTWQMEVGLRGAEYTNVIEDAIGELDSLDEDMDIPLMDPLIDEGDMAIAISEFKQMKNESDD